MTAPPTQGGLDRRDLARLGALLAVLAAITGGVVLLGGGGDGGSGQATARGTIVEVNETKLVLAPDGGGGTREFVIRPEDLRRLDLFHLRQHSQQQLPSIVTYERDGETDIAIQVDDAPTG